MEKAVFAAGCFWGVEVAFRKIPGVAEVVVGYAGGHMEKPTYESVCTGGTGHAESVEVTFDPEVLPYRQLVDQFWGLHDPTTRNRQGADIGSQYRSAIFPLNETQQAEAQASREAAQPNFATPIVTEISLGKTFWLGEERHQRFLEKRGRA